ncbi:MAG: YoaK family protein [Limosilactobacillus sp.]
MHNIFNQRNLAEARFFAVALTFCGGFADAFTYIQCNHTLAAAQTGNIVFLSAALANHNVLGVVDRLSSLIAYIVGLAIVSAFHAHIAHYWRVFCLIPILIIGVIVGGLPASFPTYISVPAISFGLAMQNAAFAKVEGLGYSSVFTSGNIKKSVVAWSEYYFHHDLSQRRAAIDYSLIVGSFALGAIASAQLQPFLKMKTIWIAVLVILIVNVTYYIQKWSRESQK